MRAISKVEELLGSVLARLRKLWPWRRDRSRRLEVKRVETFPLAAHGGVNRLLGPLFDDPFGVADLGLVADGLWSFPRTELVESDDHFTLTVEMPGVDPGALEVSTSGDILRVRAESREERQEKGNGYRLLERRYGSFDRTMRLPGSADPAQIQARYRNGLLTVRIGKRAEARARRIPVKVR